MADRCRWIASGHLGELIASVEIESRIDDARNSSWIVDDVFVVNDEIVVDGIHVDDYSTNIFNEQQRKQK